MSLRFVDGFAHYATADLLTKWNAEYNTGAVSVLITSTNRGTSSGSLEFNIRLPDDHGYIYKILDSQSTWIIGAAVMFTGGFGGYGSLNASLFTLNDINTGNQTQVGVDGTGRLAIYRGSTLLSTSTNVLMLNQWNYLEFKTTIASSGGLCEVKENGNVWATFSGNTQNTGVATANRIYVGPTNNVGSVANWYFTDMYFCDGQGTANNDYLGDCSVRLLLPNGAGTDTAFTQTGGTGGQPWTAVNNATPDGDTSYVADSLVGDSETFAFSDLSGSPGVRGVVLDAILRKDDAGTRTVSAIARPGVTDNLGTAWSPGGSYALTQTIWETNPDTSNPWQATEVNAAEFGIKNVS